MHPRARRPSWRLAPVLAACVLLCSSPAWSQSVSIEGIWPDLEAVRAIRILGAPTSLRWGERGCVTLSYRDRCDVTVSPAGRVECIEGFKASVCGLLLEPQEIQQMLGPPNIQDAVGTVWMEAGLCVLQSGGPQFGVVLSARFREMRPDWTPSPWDTPVTRWEVGGVRLGLSREEVERAEGPPKRRSPEEGPGWSTYRSGVRVHYRCGFVDEVHGQVLGREEGQFHPLFAEAGGPIPPPSVLEQAPPSDDPGTVEPGEHRKDGEARFMGARARFFMQVDLRLLLDTCVSRESPDKAVVFTREREGLNIVTAQGRVAEFHLSRAADAIFPILEQALARKP